MTVLYSVGQRRRHLLAKGDLSCIWCKRRLGPLTLTVDHLVPVSKGGRNTPENLAPACGKCNHHRGDIDADDYRRLFPNGAPSNYRGLRNGRGPGLSDPAEQLRRRLRKAEDRALQRARS